MGLGRRTLRPGGGPILSARCARSSSRRGLVAVFALSLAVTQGLAARASDEEPAALPSSPVHEEPVRESASLRWSPVQVGIANPLQAVPDHWAIRGLRLGGVTRNAAVHGADVGFVSLTQGRQSGFQGGFFNHVGGDLSGLQISATYAAAEGTVRGLQLAGATSSAGTLRGGQLAGFVNVANEVHGAQIGLVNYTERLSGLQLGLLNVNRDGWIPVLPLVNFGF